MKKISLFVLFFGFVLPLMAGSSSLVIRRAVEQASGGGGGGGDILVGDNVSTGGSATINSNTLGFTWDGDKDGSGNSPYTAVKTGTVAKAVIGLAADISPASNGKVCVYDSSDNLIGCCSGALSGSANEDYELTTCDSISISNGTGYYLGFIPDDDNQEIVVNSAGTFKIDTDNSASYASPPDPKSSIGNINTGWPRIYVTD